MRTDPNAHTLLELAAATLRRDVLPHLPPEGRYAALMVSNALAMAERELRGLDDSGRAMLLALVPLCGADADPSLTGEELATRVDALQHRLCIEIATGAFDGDGQDLLMDALEAIVRARLSIANPRAVPAS
ncbi:DUF6285 domain-containing protein [Azospirillum griseum]|uniref:Acyl-CoA dehydrogenase n=1 Tax=Azospirillum griseum TaxID=2496639 RepID=A0A431VBY6_9PROT|nr:DUF6285 domain-containing protein [Azospirillum griseum]RTR16008.1 acyl-CoA dehydrogenase [Azospirillum griseum]